MGKYGAILEKRYSAQVESAQIGGIQRTGVQEVSREPSRQTEITQEDMDFIQGAATHLDRQIIDPRPDLKDDSLLWRKLLKLAHGRNGNLSGVLHGFRCMGTRIKKIDGGWVLRPQIDPAGNLAWPSETEYAEAKKKWLEPYRKEIVSLLGQLNIESKMRAG